MRSSVVRGDAWAREALFIHPHYTISPRSISSHKQKSKNFLLPLTGNSFCAFVIEINTYRRFENQLSRVGKSIKQTHLSEAREL